VCGQRWLVKWCGCKLAIRLEKQMCERGTEEGPYIPPSLVSRQKKETVENVSDHQLPENDCWGGRRCHYSLDNTASQCLFLANRNDHKGRYCILNSKLVDRYRTLHFHIFRPALHVRLDHVRAHKGRTIACNPARVRIKR